MKKVASMTALALAVGLASCTPQGPKGKMSNDIDSLSYAFGMAHTQGLTDYLQQQGIDSTHLVTFLKGFKAGTNQITTEDFAYTEGVRIGQMVSKRWIESLNQQLFMGDSTQTVNRDLIIEGFVAGVTGGNSEMEMFMAQEYERTKTIAITERTLLKKYADNKAAGEKFLAENKEKEGVITTESGLQYKIITKGKGEIPQKDSRVKLHYRGTLIDGTEFESSSKYKNKNGNAQPATFRVNQVIKGWSEALCMMPVGSKWEIYIPQELAYGNRQAGQLIKPFSTLVFEVELLDIVKEDPNKKK